MEIIAVYSDNHVHYINTVCGKMKSFLMLYQVYVYLPPGFKEIKINLQLRYWMKKFCCAWSEKYEAHSW
jgi:hypothetical protein